MRGPRGQWAEIALLLAMVCAVPGCKGVIEGPLGEGDAAASELDAARDAMVWDGPPIDTATDDTDAFVSRDDAGARDAAAAEDGLRVDASPDGSVVTPPVDASPDGGAVGSPEAFTQSVFEMDFDQGTNGRFRGNGGAWQDFASWSQFNASGSGWSNVAVWVQTTSAVRTEIVANALGSGRVLRTWIEEGDQWTATNTYPRTELISSSYTADVPYDSEWRMEMPCYASGDLASSTDSVLGFQLHQNSGSGPPPFALHATNGILRFCIREAPGGPTTCHPTVAIQQNARLDVVLEAKFGYVANGAYVKLWVNGTQYVDVTDRNVGYPALEPASAGYWKFCSLYDWDRGVNGSRSLYSGPTFKLLKKP